MRADVAIAQAEYGVSKLRACKLLGVDRASYSFYPLADRNAELREELVKLTWPKPRYGYRWLHAVLERRGEVVNVKSEYRPYAYEGLKVRRRERLTRDREAEPRLVYASHECAIDFIEDGLAN